MTPASKKRHVLAFDMGKTDMAWAWSYDNKLIDTGLMINTVNDLKSGIFLMQVRKFIRELKSIVQRVEAKHGPLTDICVERYVSRPGKGGGAVSESINVMIGIMAAYCNKHNLYLELILASTWKNHFKRKFGCDTQAERYGFKITKTSKKWPILDHNFDAIGLMQFRLETTRIQGDGFAKLKPHLELLDSFKSVLKRLWKQREEQKSKDLSVKQARKQKKSKPKRK
jgi:hypothetical protein